ncbi:hypothetical protein M2102_000897 [Fusobacterium sp. PH5-7]|uniref:glycosyltransferase n=1 Tax=Fusobacterium sp. PH5-7 TaxID=2940528 RepID=UPI002476913D|nr:glycosyltransferase [Fusobacterium sp. PH5-7]MDH6457281.1 hypothetical protein [Fusobacterium sp. PH5-7]
MSLCKENKNKKIYLIGSCVEIESDSRNIYMIRSLLDMGEVYYDGYKIKITKNKYINKILNILNSTILFPTKFFKMLNSDLVIILAMNQNKVLEILLAKILKKKVILDYFLSNYDTVICDRKIYSENSIFSKIYKFQDKNALKTANKIIFITRIEVERYLKIAGLSHKNISYDIIPLAKEDNFLIKGELPFFNNNNEITICWWGTYIPLHGLDKIILAGKILKEKNIKFKMYLFGNSEERSIPYMKQIKKMNLGDKIIIRNDYTFKNKKLPEFLIKNCDIALGNFGDSEKAKNVMLYKIVDALCLKIPILNGESIALDEFFDYENDLFRSLNTSEDIANKIIEISFLSKDEIDERVKIGYQNYQKYFSFKAFKDKVTKLVEETE